MLFGPPTYVFFNAGGEEIPDLRVVGFQDAALFKTTLDRALSQ
jgi:thiol:disulfide interchange protein DsbD